MTETKIARNGKTVIVRPIEISDADAIRRFYEHCSIRTINRRFHGIIKEPWRNVDLRQAEMLVSVVEHEGVIIGIGELHPPSEEFALIIADDWQRQGIGTMLFDEIKQHAKDLNLPKIIANVLFTNREIISFCRKHGFKKAGDDFDETTMIFTVS